MSFTESILKPLTGPSHYLELGPLSVYILNEARLWKVAFDHLADQSDRWSSQDTMPEDANLDDLKWVSFAAGEGEQLRLQSLLPSLPVVVRPATPVILRPGEKLSFFMSVPMSIRVVSDRDPKLELLQEPTVNMSSTWVGDRNAGKLAVASRTQAFTELAALDKQKHRIICPVRMRNLSKTPLPFDRFVLPSDCLDIYQGQERFWTNEVGISYKGEREGSRVAPSPAAPAHEKDLTKVHKAEKQRSDLFHLRSFFHGGIS